MVLVIELTKFTWGGQGSEDGKKIVVIFGHVFLLDAYECFMLANNIIKPLDDKNCGERSYFPLLSIVSKGFQSTVKNHLHRGV